MNTVCSITTKLRPIKKLLLIDPEQRSVFGSFLRMVSEEISGFRNIVLLNDNTLFFREKGAFVDRHDPDVILNYSKFPDEDLRDKFRTRVHNGNDSRVKPTAFGTRLSMFTNVPMRYRPYVSYDTEDVVIPLVREPQQELTENEFVFALNCGVVSNQLPERLKRTIFDDLRIKPLSTESDFWEVVQDKDRNLLYKSEQFASSSTSDSIYHEDFNDGRLFQRHNGKALVVANPSDMAAIAFFWNMRASHPFTHFVLLTPELLAKRPTGFRSDWCIDFTGVVTATDDLGTLLNGSEQKYVFSDYSDWNSFSYEQTVLQVGDELTIAHPAERQFFPGHQICVFEVVGLEPAILPKSEKLAELFVGKPHPHVPEEFRRISRRGLVWSVRDVAFLSDAPLQKRLRVPNSAELITAIFEENDLELRETDVAKSVNRAIQLLGGTESLVRLRKRALFDLLVSLAPKRGEQIAKAIAKQLSDKIDYEELRNALERTVGDVTSLKSSKTVSSSDVVQRVGGDVAAIESLVQDGVLLRGKHFKCPACGVDLWFQLEGLPTSPRCYGCDSEVHIPLFNGGVPLNDALRLNELFIRAVDQGILPVLNVLSILSSQRYWAKRTRVNCDVYNKTNTWLGEVDIAFTLGTKVGLAEVKADRGFSAKSSDRFVEIASRAKAQVVLFATMKSSTSPEVCELVKYLDQKQLPYPALILTGEVLFDERTPELHRYIEIDDDRKPPRPGPRIVDLTNGTET